jgi:hypothetical protein
MDVRSFSYSIEDHGSGQLTADKRQQTADRGQKAADSIPGWMYVASRIALKIMGPDSTARAKKDSARKLKTEQRCNHSVATL